MRKKTEKEEENKSSNSGIVIKNLSKVFEDKKKVLDNVSIHFKKNQITGLIGFNGSGKTTTFNLLANFLEKHEGSILIDGKPVDVNIKRKICYLAAGAEPKNMMRASTHLYALASLYGNDRQTAKDKIESIAKVIEFTPFLQKPIKSLSKGNQQKIKIIASMLNPKAEYLFLDEPFDGLDPLMVKKVVKLYKELKNMTIIITSHRMEVINEMCKEFYVLKDGKLIDSRRTDDKMVIVELNPELPIERIKKIKFVNNVKKQDGKITLELSDISEFKRLNIHLLSYDEYVFSSIKDKNIAESVFKGYGA